MLRRPWVIALAAVIVAAVAFVGLRLVVGSSGRYTLRADFADTTGLYVGNEVQYLGVPVGKVDKVTPMGTVMRVTMSLDRVVKIPRHAGAQIMQSALLTDRYVDIGPAYRGGAALPAGSLIPSSHTRAPVSFDDISASIDALVVALNERTPDGRGIGDLVSVVAQNLDGNGGRIRRLITSSTAALSSINSDAPDLEAVAKNLDVLAKALGDNDAMVHRFVTNMSDASTVVASQTSSLDQTLSALSGLMTQVSSFVQANRANLTADLKDVSSVTATIRSEQSTLAHIFDNLPTGAENITRAFDPAAQSMRVEIAARNLSQALTDGFCKVVPLPASACGLLTNNQGTGVLDALIQALAAAIPGKF